MGGLAFRSGGSVVTHSLVVQNSGNTAGGAHIVTDSGSGFATFLHNNIHGNPSPSTLADRNLRSGDDSTTHLATNNYWGGEVSDKSLMFVFDGETGGGTGLIDVGSAQAQPFPLCSVDAADSECVGAP